MRKNEKIENNVKLKDDVQSFFEIHHDHPSLGHQLTELELTEMLIGTPFYTYSESAGLQLRIKKDINKEELFCLSEKSGASVRFKISRMGKFWFAFAANFPNKSSQNKKVYSVISWQPNNPDSISLQCFENEESARKSIEVSANTCFRMAGGNIVKDEKTTRLLCQNGTYCWHLVERVVQ